MDRGRVGSLIVGSKSCAEKVWRMNHEGHQNRVKSVRSCTQLGAPETMGMDHFRTNLKKERLLEDRYMEIDRENNNLLRKMAEAMRAKPDFMKDAEKKGDKCASLNRNVRKTELQRISKENQRMLKAIQRAQPVYSAHKWDENYKKSAAHLSNCSHYPIVIRKMNKNASAPSVLMQIGSQDDSVFRATGASDASNEGGREEDRNVVLKEGKRIGETYFLLEMSTDGRALCISAYEGESQMSLELVVKEKRHRQLYREANGDYSIIAAKLRVEGNRLILEPPSGDGGVPKPGSP